MLTEERKSQIIKIVDEQGSVSVQELMTILDTSESTIRRDLNELDKKGLLVKVHGGAISVSGSIVTYDMPVSERETLNLEAKKKIAQYAAKLIRDEDIVFLDAGTTTGVLIDYLVGTKAVFVTNAVNHARKLSAMGFQVFMPSGTLKARTEALVGSDTCDYVKKFHFTKGFFGANGVTLKQGLTTPDRNEAAVKETAFSHCKECFVLADHSKFEQISAVTFADFEYAKIITTEGIPAPYYLEENVVVL